MAYQPRGKTFEEFAPGESFETPRRTVTEADIVNFAGLSGDFNALHLDEEFARTTPYGKRIAHGMLVLSIVTGLSQQSGQFEGTVLGFLGLTGKFTGPTFAGDTLHAVFRVENAKATRKPDRGVVVFAITVVNQRGETVAETEWTVMMRRRSGGEAAPASAEEKA